MTIDVDRRPPEVAVIPLTAHVQAPPRVAWNVVGEFDALGRFLDVRCRMLAGDGGIGSVRLIGDDVVEVLIGATARSYSYAQTVGPMAPFHYHGTVSLERYGSGCRLSYTIVYDETAMGDVRRACERERIATRFGGALDEMKALAESQPDATRNVLLHSDIGGQE